MRTATFLICAGFLLTAGCSNTANTTSANTMTDSDVERAIHARLDANADLRAANLDVDADVKDNKIKLSGTVPTEALRIQAVEIAKEVRPAMAPLQNAARQQRPDSISLSEGNENSAVRLHLHAPGSTPDGQVRQ